MATGTRESDDDAAAPLPDRPRLEAREAPDVGDARRHDAGRVYPSPVARTNAGRLIYAGHAGEIARHAARPAAGERAAPLQPHVVGDGDEVAGGRALHRLAPAQTHRHDEPDDLATLPSAEEREERPLERRGRPQVRSRERLASGRSGNRAAPAARHAASSGGQDERDGLAGHPASAGVAGEARLERLDGVDRRGVDAVQQGEVAAHVVAQLHEREEPREP